MSIDNILLLGNEKLYSISDDVNYNELEELLPKIDELHQTVLDYRKEYGVGRAIAAPQLGLNKRIICYNVDKPVTMINPVIHNKSKEMIELWDDCMSFPNLLVKVRRHKSCIITYKDLNWNETTWELNDDLSELFQHEYDHLDGILATERAIDSKSFKLKKS